MNVLISTVRDKAQIYIVRGMQKQASNSSQTRSRMKTGVQGGVDGVLTGAEP